jgi:hypothetical protein
MYVYRGIEEKECRMMNFDSSSNDPHDPRNRAAFYVDLIVITDEGEKMVLIYIHMYTYMYKHEFMYI